MKRILLLCLAFLIVSVSGCSDKDHILSVYHDDEKLSEGDLVPFLLEQNMPNPFNPETVIGVQVAVTMKLKLAVYTEDWVHVETIHEGPLSPGEQDIGRYAFTFRPKDIPSGEYYYTLEGGAYTQVRKMKLVK